MGDEDKNLMREHFSLVQKCFFAGIFMNLIHFTFSPAGIAEPRQIDL